MSAPELNQGMDPAARGFTRHSDPGGRGRVAALRWACLWAIGWMGLMAGAGEVRGDPLTLRVMTYNIHHAEGTDGRIDLERIACMIRKAGADLVALQEVDRGVARTQRRDLPAELAALTGMTCLFTNNFHYQGGEYGNAILTRFPVLEWTNSHLRMVRPGEQRGLLQAVVDVHGNPLVFFATHLDNRSDDEERRQNVQELRAAAAQHGDRPILLGGDFNAVPDSRVIAAMRETWIDLWELAGEGPGYTSPSGKPRRRIDYLWMLRGTPARVRRIEVLDSPASDHAAVAAEIEWPQWTAPPVAEPCQEENPGPQPPALTIEPSPPPPD